ILLSLGVFAGVFGVIRWMDLDDHAILREEGLRVDCTAISAYTESRGRRGRETAYVGQFEIKDPEVMGGQRIEVECDVPEGVFHAINRSKGDLTVVGYTTARGTPFALNILSADEGTSGRLLAGGSILAAVLLLA